jgi:hypothetical protein
MAGSRHEGHARVSLLALWQRVLAELPIKEERSEVALDGIEHVSTR